MRNPVSNYSIFRTFMSGTKGTPMFPNGLIYEGFNDNKPIQIPGPSAALDLFMPTFDRLFGIIFPDNPLS